MTNEPENGLRAAEAYYRHLLDEERGDHDAAERRFVLHMLTNMPDADPTRCSRFARGVREYVAEDDWLNHYLAVLGPDQTVGEYADEIAGLEASLDDRGES